MALKAVANFEILTINKTEILSSENAYFCCKMGGAQEFFRQDHILHICATPGADKHHPLFP